MPDELRPALTGVEKDNLLLARWAKAEFKARRERKDFIPQDLIGEPAWDMLLYLFIHHPHRSRVRASNAYRASGVPHATAARWLAKLEQYGFVEGVPADHDKRVRFVGLTDAGRLAISDWLRFRAALDV